MTLEVRTASSEPPESKCQPRRSKRRRCERSNHGCEEADEIGCKTDRTQKLKAPRRRKVTSQKSQYFTDTEVLESNEAQETQNSKNAATGAQRRSKRIAKSRTQRDHLQGSSEAAPSSSRVTQGSRTKSGNIRCKKKPTTTADAIVDVDKHEIAQTPAKMKRRVTKKSSPYFDLDDTKPRRKGGPPDHNDETVEAVSAEISDRQPVSEDTFGLLQEVYAPDPLRVIIVAMFCTQTPGHRARPFLARLFEQYPDVEALSRADPENLAQEIRPLGLFNIRARRLIALAKEWLVAPPVPGKTSRRKGLAKKIGYPDTEVSHLPGCGPYAMDCYRLFCAGESWRGVRPDDKELRPYVQWRWSKEGVNYKQLLADNPAVR